MSRVLETGEYRDWMGHFLEFHLGLYSRSQRVKHLKEMGSKIERVGRGIVHANLDDYSLIDELLMVIRAAQPINLDSRELVTLTYTIS